LEKNSNEQKNTNIENEKPKKIMSRILSIIFILVGTLLCYPTITQRKLDSSDNLAILFSNAIIAYLLALIICVVRNKIFFKGKKKWGIFIFSSLLMFISVCNFTTAVRENSKQLAAGEYIEQVCENTDNSNPALVKDKNDYGKLTSLVTIVKEDAKKSYSINKTFDSEFKAKAPKEIITSNNVLGSEDNINKFRNNLSELNKLFAKYELDMNNDKANSDKKISAYKGENTIFEKDLINKFNFWRKEKYNKRIQELNEKKVLREKMDKYLEFMQSKQGNYKVVNKKIMFENQSDVDQCNVLIEEVKKAGATWKN
jgi:hypothetical protein